MKKFIQVYTKDSRDVIINIDYLASLHAKYSLGRCDYIFSLVNGEKIAVEQYHFIQIKEELKEMGVYFKHD